MPPHSPSYPAQPCDRSDERLTELEIKLTHQEHLLETLNQVIIEQQAELESMRARLARFERTVSNLEEEPANEPPPHY